MLCISQEDQEFLADSRDVHGFVSQPHKLVLTNYLEAEVNVDFFLLPLSFLRYKVPLSF